MSKSKMISRLLQIADTLENMGLKDFPEELREIAHALVDLEVK